MLFRSNRKNSNRTRNNNILLHNNESKEDDEDMNFHEVEKSRDRKHSVSLSGSSSTNHEKLLNSLSLCQSPFQISTSISTLIDQSSLSSSSSSSSLSSIPPSSSPLSSLPLSSSSSSSSLSNLNLMMMVYYSRSDPY